MENFNEGNVSENLVKIDYVLEASPRPLTVADVALAEKLNFSDTADSSSDKNIILLYVDKNSTSKNHFHPAERISNNFNERLFGLTKGELIVLKCLSDGKTNKAIADELFVSVNTIKTHVRSIFQKLGVNTRSAAVRSAIANNLVELT